MSSEYTELDYLYDRLDYYIWNGDKDGAKRVQEEIDKTEEANS